MSKGKEKKKQERKKVNICEEELKNLKEKAEKLEELEKTMPEQEKNIDEMKDKYLRLAAEFDNYKKRAEKEKHDIFKYSLENFVVQLIPFDDIFDSVLKQMDKNPSSEIVHQGLSMLKNEFIKILEMAGVKKIEAKGKLFDTNLHEASEVIETEDYNEGEVVEEERVGYSLNGKTIRPAIVKVAKKKEAPCNNDENNSCPCED